MYELLKRSMDVAMALVGLVLFAPLLAAVAVAIKATSPGPVFYRGVRTGRHGTSFRMFKFRTMVVGAEKLGGTTTGENDSRVTPLGRLLRQYKIDEIPQLLNVLKGEMSFVGPRPEVAEYTEQYTANQRRILSVRPGITDFSSLEFRNLQDVVGQKDTDGAYRTRVLPRKIALRLQYVDERSLATDLRILLRTVWCVAMKPFCRRT